MNLSYLIPLCFYFFLSRFSWIQFKSVVVVASAELDYSFSQQPSIIKASILLLTLGDDNSMTCVKGNAGCYHFLAFYWCHRHLECWLSGSSFRTMHTHRNFLHPTWRNLSLEFKFRYFAIGKFTKFYFFLILDLYKSFYDSLLNKHFWQTKFVNIKFSEQDYSEPVH